MCANEWNVTALIANDTPSTNGNPNRNASTLRAL
jgi:hypothetical protein